MGEEVLKISNENLRRLQRAYAKRNALLAEADAIVRYVTDDVAEEERLPRGASVDLETGVVTKPDSV